MTIDLEAIKARLEGVTKGPWAVRQTVIHGKNYGGCWVEIENGSLIPMSGSGGSMSYTSRILETQCHDHNDANARFIAAARADIPALVAEVERLRDALTQIAGNPGYADDPWSIARAALKGPTND